MPGEHPFGSWKYVPGDGDKNPELVVVQKSPSPDDAKGGRCLLGRDGLTIRRALFKLGVPFYTTYAVPFFDPETKPVKKHGDACALMLGEELRRTGAKRIVYLGPDPARWAPPHYTVPFRVFRDVEGRTLTTDAGTHKLRITHASTQVAAVPAVHDAFLTALEDLMSSRDEALTTMDEDGGDYRVLKNPTQIRRALAKMGKRVSLDLETTSLDPYTGRILTVNVSWETGTGYAFPWVALPPEEWARAFAGRKLIFQNGQFDLKYLACNGVFLRMDEDAMLMHSLVDETPGTHAMDQLAPKYLGIDKWSETVDYDNLEATDFRTLGRYGARDADITYRLADTFRPRVGGRTIHRVLTDAANALVVAERRGVRVDRGGAAALSEQLAGMLHDREVKFQECYGVANVNSTKQVAELLFDRLGVPENPRPNQKYKKRSTDEKVIGKYREEVPAIAELLEYRNLAKAKNTYVDKILELTERDGRYHSEFKLAATETGRLTEKLITLIPRPTGADDANEGKKIQQQLRHLFIPDEGYVFIGGDYAALEVRMAALLSLDKQLIEDMNADRDTHSLVAIPAFDLDIPVEPIETLKKRVEEKYSHYRSLSKMGTFTWLFGGTVGAIQRQLNVTRTVASAIMDALKSRYLQLAAYQEALVGQVKDEGVIYSLWGRPRHFSFGRGMDAAVERDQEREAINFPIQSSSTDLNLKAFSDMTHQGYETLFPLHDACYVQAPREQAEEVAAALKRTMESAVSGPVLFKADVKIGESWGDLG